MTHHTRRVFPRTNQVFHACFLSAFSVAVVTAGCGHADVEKPRAETTALPTTSYDITAEDLSAHTRALSDDTMLGRGPGQDGEAVTLEYLTAAYERIGLKPVGDASLPGAPPGSPKFLQTVELVGITADDETSRLSFGRNEEATLLDLEHGLDFMTWTTTPEEVVDISGRVVFAGYGIDAPEEGWNDFGETDVTGKILLVLPGEPPTEDPDRFRGEEMTYYGRRSSKIEQGARRGAAGVLLIHEPETAGSTWDVIKGRTGERLQKTDRSVLPSGTPLQGWITGTAASEVFQIAGLDLERLKSAAAREEFTAVDLGIAATAHLDNTIRPVTSSNVVGVVEGSDPEHADEYILFVGHWDHLGVGEEVDGDAIYNGAIDNAIGTAAILEVAEAWASAQPAPRRSAVFVASTAEESGFLGVVSYIENPVAPLARTLAAINIDGVNVWGPTEDVWIVGMGLTTLEDDLAEVLEKNGRRLSPDPAPEEGNFFRSDHFPFAQAGVPVLCVRPGMKFVGEPDGFGEEIWSDYYFNRYHRPSDEFDAAWDFNATAQDVEAMFEVALRVSAADTWPRWYPGNEFKATRDTMMREVAGVGLPREEAGAKAREQVVR